MAEKGKHRAVPVGCGHAIAGQVWWLRSVTSVSDLEQMQEMCLSGHVCKGICSEDGREEDLL